MHIPVLCEEVVAYLDPVPGEVILDCTVNGGGHAEAILNKIIPGGLLIGIDQDEEALKSARERLSKFEGTLKLVKANFSYLDEVLGNLGIEGVDGMLFDLGLSSLQLEDANRGFSMKLDGPLDMRMDLNNPVTASDIVNKSSEEEIDWILRMYGQERWHKRIAHSIVKRRQAGLIERTMELVRVVEGAIPHRGKTRIHPATRTFQALRIAVNKELASLESALKKAVNFLKSDAKICVLSYHSLEDRIVKESFKTFAKENVLHVLNKKPIRPTEAQIRANPRCRSVRLRAAHRL